MLSRGFTPVAPSVSHRFLIWGLVCAVLVVAPACRSTERFLDIQTDPPGADIWINGEKQASKTPVRHPFVHYGTVEIRVEKKGYESVAKELTIPTPRDGLPGFDLIAEHTMPTSVTRRTIKLTPLQGGNADERVDKYLKNAEAFRAESIRAAGNASERAQPLGKE